VALEAQPLDTIPLIRRKRGGEGDPTEASPAAAVDAPPLLEAVAGAPDTARALQMKPRETVQLAAVHVRIPEQLARGLRLMSVLEGRQAQVIVAEMLEEHLTRWNPKWRDSVPRR
jgi:hypothetical protein